jgi:hypothetical protein
MFFFEQIFRYLPALSKTIKLDIKRCNQEQLRRPVDCYTEDVIRTYKALKSHWPTFSAKDLAELPNKAQPMFLVPKPKFKKSDSVWFLKSPVGKNPLGKTVKTLVEGTPEINSEGRNFTNKTAKRIGITRMEECMVPMEKGMTITGHRDMKSYSKYNAFVPDSEQRACQDIISGDSALAQGKSVNYQDLVIHEKLKVKAKQVYFL